MADSVKETIRNTGLHFCTQYNNLVRFNPKFCGKCPHSSLNK
ncbi:MAG: hypothetical protein NTV61_04770 [Candidatus Bathyarchaeota archaeon]|nr:hypothetical protein [Candidatus Bathyarchaeota archaeon]